MLKSYRVGDRVTVMNQTLNGETIVEGEAVIREVLGGDRYMVNFATDGPSELYERHVAHDQAVA